MNEENREKGEAFDSSTGFELPNGSNGSPDSSWVWKSRWDALTSEQKQTFPQVFPDFAITKCHCAISFFCPLK